MALLEASDREKNIEKNFVAFFFLFFRASFQRLFLHSFRWSNIQSLATRERNSLLVIVADEEEARERIDARQFSRVFSFLLSDDDLQKKKKKSQRRQGIESARRSRDFEAGKNKFANDKKTARTANIHCTNFALAASLETIVARGIVAWAS